MLEEIFIICFYRIIYLKIEGGEKVKNFFWIKPYSPIPV